MPKISSLKAREILDSRGVPTLEVELTLDGKFTGRAAAPAGASTGSHEAKELRDGDKRYFGEGVETAIGRVTNEMAPAVLHQDFDQAAFDQKLIELDGTPNKSRLGGNTTTALSLAFAEAASRASGEPLFKYLGALAGNQEFKLPTPLFNVINGGKHALGSTDFQEFFLIPTGVPNFKEALRWGAEIYHALKQNLTAQRLPTTVGDEGGFAPPLEANQKAVELLMTAISAAGYTPANDIAIGLDAAASVLKDGETYDLRCEDAELTTEALIRLYESWQRKYPITLIEDGLAEDEWEGWAELTARLGATVTLVGDDLFVTNAERIKKGIAQKAANAVLLKPNQVGTVTETLAAARAAREGGYKLVVSHRSGETESVFISHLAVALGAEFIKAGAPARGERVAKYNELLRIEELLSK